MTTLAVAQQRALFGFLNRGRLFGYDTHLLYLFDRQKQALSIFNVAKLYVSVREVCRVGPAVLVAPGSVGSLP